MRTSEAPRGWPRLSLVDLGHTSTARAALVIAVLLAAAWTAVLLAGGTRSAFPHLFYVPIVIAAVPFGRRGSVGVALLAGVLCGPLMPLDARLGEPQSLSNWLWRSLFFVIVAFFAATALAAVEQRYRDELVRQLGRELRPRRSDAADGVAVDTPPEDGAMAEVLAQRRFHPVFQPVYSLHDGRLVAVEALTRFDTDPQAAPDIWFARAARAGLGEQLELAAIAAAIAASDQLPGEVALSVNCSPRTLVRPELLQLVAERRPRPLIVEVTEHAAVDDYATLTDAVDRLRQHDVRLAVDDAGAGFASLRHVVRLDPELIKLDLSLVQNLRGDPVKEALADCLIDFARRTGSRLVAEGIEHPADLVTWVDLGADAGQGYLLGLPGPLPVEMLSDRVVRSLPG